MTNNTHNKDSLILPAGWYYIGDPCYVLKGDGEWDKVCGQLDHLDHLGYGGGSIVVNARQVVIFQTAYGDGDYPDNYGRSYPVDSGLIGAVPVELMPEHQRRGDWTNGDWYSGFNPGHVLEFSEPFECRREADGTLKFGEIVVNTGDSHEEAD